MILSEPKIRAIGGPPVIAFLVTAQGYLFKKKKLIKTEVH